MSAVLASREKCSRNWHRKENCPRNWHRGRPSRNWHRDRLKGMSTEFASQEEKRRKNPSSEKGHHVGQKLPVEFMRRFITRKCNLLRGYGNISSLVPPIFFS